MSERTLEQVLEEDGILYHTSKGVSMRPLIREGKDVLVIKKPAGRLKKYDIPLYKRDSGEYVLHRILKVREKDYVICSKSHLLATDACKNDVNGSCAVTERLVEIDAPTEYCTGHTTIQWCEGGHGRANEYCSSVPGNTVRVGGIWNGEDVPTCTVHSAASLTPQPAPAPSPEPPAPEPPAPDGG